MVCNDEMCLPPKDVDFAFELAAAKEKPSGFEMCPEIERSHHSGVEEDDKSESDSPKEEEEDSIWGLFIFGLIAGFLALLTPCVIISYAFGREAMYNLSVNEIFNIFMFILLFVFGLSFLGAFEITLPTSWANKADKAADKGGLLGIFFMAATLAIVSFSCTGPLIGTALAGAAGGGLLAPGAVMFGFSLALSIPFALFAIFPSWLNSMPDSGGWLNAVKVVLGLLEIGFAFKFLSNADLFGGGGHSSLHVEPMFKNDLEAAQAKSKEENKPVLIDYTGWTCVNCRRMEENVWVVPEVAEILRNEVILVSLYTDDLTDIDESKKRKAKLNDGNTLKIKNLGDEWKLKQANNHNTLAQPLYAFEDEKGNLIVPEGIGYGSGDPNDFIEFLEKGLKAFKSK